MTPKITLFYYNNNNTFEAIVDLDKCPISQGIWCLYGYKNNSWSCLQVARSNVISEELRSDITSIIEPITLEETSYSYINQFGRKADNFKTYPSIRSQVYSKIGDTYANEKLYFFIFEFIDASHQKEAEKYFAYKTQALYWRNGGSYKKECTVDITKLLSSVSPTPKMINTFNKMIAYIEKQGEFN